LGWGGGSYVIPKADLSLHTQVYILYW